MGKLETVYDKLVENFPETSPEAVEACVQCLHIAATLNLEKEQLCDQFGITPGKLSLLMLLWQCAEGSMTPSELAAAAGVTRATTSHFVDALERDKLIAREESSEDRRVTRIALTPKANQMLKRLLPLHLQRMERMVTVLTRPERKQLITILEKLVRGPREISSEDELSAP